jgi:phospholipid/cholesterol/gamma-HCH transport system substrate-binding protein
MKRIMGLLIAVALVASGCSMFGGSEDEGREIKARFSRAVQVFPGNSVRVLGVTIGRVTDVENVDGAAEVTLRIDEPDIKLPDDVSATIVPVSLLGERYIQLFPAYDGGAEFTADVIDTDRTSVPAEQDELLRGLQDYFGALDPDKVSKFVTDAATILDENGEGINRLIEEASSVVGTLSDKRDSLAGLITQLNRLTVTLSTRQAALGRVINSYNTVGHALTDNRLALEGTITGLNQAASELASLLIEHRDPLGADIKTLTTSLSTLSRNSHRFARTGHWAQRLFNAASKAMDFDRDWLRLGNQGEPLFELITFRLQDRLTGVCLRLGIDECSNQRYWEKEMPNLFCQVDGSCESGQPKTPGEAIADALDDLPDEVGDEVDEELGLDKNCKKAKHPKKCRKRLKNKDGDRGDELDQLLDDILDDLEGTTGGLTEGTGIGL